MSNRINSIKNNKKYLTKQFNKIGIIISDHNFKPYDNTDDCILFSKGLDNFLLYFDSEDGKLVLLHENSKWNYTKKNQYHIQFETYIPNFMFRRIRNLHSSRKTFHGLSSVDMMFNGLNNTERFVLY